MRGAAMDSEGVEIATGEIVFQASHIVWIDEHGNRVTASVNELDEPTIIDHTSGGGDA